MRLFGSSAIAGPPHASLLNAAAGTRRTAEPAPSRSGGTRSYIRPGRPAVPVPRRPENRSGDAPRTNRAGTAPRTDPAGDARRTNPAEDARRTNPAGDTRRTDRPGDAPRTGPAGDARRANPAPRDIQESVR